MRDPTRIPKLLNLIQKEWEKHPDMRLCQLLYGLTRSIKTFGQNDMFYIEDDRLQKVLEDANK